MEFDNLNKDLNQETSSSGLMGFCEQFGLLKTDEDVIKVPFLIKGKLRAPRDISLHRIMVEFAKKDEARGVSQAPATRVVIDEQQVLREEVIDRDTLKPMNQYLYSIMPEFEASEVIESRPEDLLELYNLPFEEVLNWTESVRLYLQENSDFIEQLKDETLQTSTHPDFWHESAFAAIDMLMDKEGLRAMVDQDISAWGKTGSELLDHWVQLEAAAVMPAPVNLLGDMVAFDGASRWEPRVPELRAMPTRQLHITAGNSPQIPFISALRAIVTKSAAVIKSPYGATAPGALLALAAGIRQPDHPITKHLSIVYWPGGDSRIEDPFFRPDSFDRIVVWGAPQAVSSVKSRALFTKVLTFNPRYGVSFLGKEAFSNKVDLEELATRTVSDALVANQKACIASQVVYVEGSDQEISELAKALQYILAKFDEEAPNYVPPSSIGEIKRLQRGLFLDDQWYVNSKDGRFSSGVVVVDHEFNIMKHPMNRLIVVRKVERLTDVVPYLHHGVSTVSVFPEERRVQLRDAISSRGVSNVVPIGQSGSGFMGQSHDGMMALTELVDWKNG